MFQKKKILALIPARGGSKGVPRKNLREVEGKPLIAWTIEAAKNSKYLDKLVLSSDDPEIAKTALRWGCEVPFMRPSELAQDDTPGIAPALHALEQLPDFDYLMLLQPTSPLRSNLDIDQAVELCLGGEYDSLVSVTEAQENPHWMYKISPKGKLAPAFSSDEKFERRQDLPTFYSLNGAIYLAKSQSLKIHKSFMTSETVPYLMPPERSLDIDSELDLNYLQFILSMKNGKYSSFGT